MHLRNPYRVPPNFQELAEKYPLLKPYVFINSHGQPAIDFKDVAAQRYLTEALLRRDFGLRLSLPPDRLCPAVPNRLNYVLWLQDVITASPPTGEIVRGIDVGTGASTIYPLLACKLSDNWNFIGTDIDTLSLQFANDNVKQNRLESRIRIVPSSPDGPILESLFEDETFSCDFVMCNPPFYSSTEDVQKSAESKEFDPHAVCTGADVEMITEGGEAGFVGRILRESIRIGIRCRWYTSLLGKLSSIASTVTALRAYHIDNYGITEFVQGHTRRWAVIWSFGEDRLPDTLARITSLTIHPYLPLPNNLRQQYPSARDSTQLLGLLAQGGLEVVEISAKRNTWSRAARRQQKAMSTAGPSVPIDDDVAMACFVHCARTEVGELYLEASWVKGGDRSLFETFWSHTSRKVGTGLVEGDVV